MRMLALAENRPDIRYAWCGASCLVLGVDGTAGVHALSGFFFRQTRFLRTLRFEIAGKAAHLCSLATLAPHTIEAAWIHPEVTGGGGGGSGSGGGEQMDGIIRRNLDILVRLQVLPASFDLEFCITNRWQETIDVPLAWLLTADFASVDEAQFGKREQDSPVGAAPCPGGVLFRYTHPQLPLSTHVRATGAAFEYSAGRLETTLKLARQQTKTVHLRVRAIDPENPIDDGGESDRLARLDEWYTRAVTVHSSGESAFVGAVDHAIRDLGSFALLEGPQDEWLVPGAGLPLYQTVWGRDTLTTAWQAGLFDGGEMLSDVLTFLGRRQGSTIDPQRDEEPGRIINQAKSDPLSRIGQSPFGRYYADFASPFMYIISMGFHYVLTAHREVLQSHWATANAILQWADEYGDGDGDGYLEYLTRSPRGPTHQGWKDSENAIVDEHGHTVQPPIAPCEIQGYWYAALVYMAALSAVLGDRERARSLWEQARKLKERFNRDFWMEDEAFIALGLDAEKKPIRAITSNPGHCLPCGIISAEHIPRVVRRLFASDLFSGWGIRTLSTGNPAYQPLDYHLGNVWPVENATILFGLRRYGFNDRALELTRALHDLALLWPGGRIPECVGGYARSESAHPGAYPRANVPQTWNQSALPLVLQCLLGLVPVAPLRLLLVDPILPPWLPELTVSRIPVADSTVTIRFARDSRGRSRFKVLEKNGKLRVIRQPWIESFDAGWLDRILALRRTVFA